jgi:hypothetical protein
MAKKGRPFVYHKDEERPVTISFRLPPDLYTRLEQYAKQHRQSRSELARDGIEWRLGEGDPRGLGDTRGSSRRHNGEAYYDNTASEMLGDVPADSARMLAEHGQILTRLETQVQALVQAFERQATPASVTPHEQTEVAPEPRGDTKRQTANVPEPARTTAEDKLRTTAAPGSAKRQTGNVPARTVGHSMTPEVGDLEPTPAAPEIVDQNTPIRQATIPSYDPTKFYLGKLCPQHHEYENTGQSLLRRHNQYCRECARLGKQAARAKRHQVTA